MHTLMRKKIALVLSYKGSLKAWKEAGILERELFLYRSLKPHFKDIVFISFSSNQEEEQMLLGSVGSVLTNRWRLPAPLYALGAWFLHRRALKKIDVIKTNQMSAFLLAFWIKLMSPRKGLITRAGFQWSQFQKHTNTFKKIVVAVLEFIAYQISNHIIVTSLADRDYVARRYLIATRNITVISNLIDTNLFKPDASERIKNRVCSVGRLESQKNFNLLIEALAGTDFKLWLYGAGTKEAELRELASTKGVDVQFKGRVSNLVLAKELSSCSVFVLPSSYEGNPKALLEAMAVGLPVIVSRIKAHESIIIHDENGILIEQNAQEIKGALNKVLTDAQLAQRLGASARDYIIKNASPDAVVSAELGVYNQVL